MSCRCCSSWAEHFRSIGTIGETTRHHNRRDTQLSRDLGAYKRLTEDGFEPARIDGCAQLEARQAPRHEIEGGLPVDVEV